MARIMSRTHPRRRRTYACQTRQHTKYGFMRTEEIEQELLPRILDEITVGVIAPKLQWKTFYILLSMSRAWRRAIQSHEVYNTRVFSKAAETLVVINQFVALPGKAHSIAIYSMRDKSVSLLPPTPNICLGIPIYCHSIAMDGKVCPQRILG